MRVLYLCTALHGLQRKALLPQLQHQASASCSIPSFCVGSQNHSTSRVGRDPQESLSPTRAPHRTTQNQTIHLRVLSRHLLNSVKLGTMATSLGNMFHCPIILLVKNLLLISSLITCFCLLLTRKMQNTILV